MVVGSTIQVVAFKPIFAIYIKEVIECIAI